MKADTQEDERHAKTVPPLAVNRPVPDKGMMGAKTPVVTSFGRVKMVSVVGDGRCRSKDGAPPLRATARHERGHATLRVKSAPASSDRPAAARSHETMA